MKPSENFWFQAEKRLINSLRLAEKQKQNLETISNYIFWFLTGFFMRATLACNGLIGRVNTINICNYILF